MPRDPRRYIHVVEVQYVAGLHIRDADRGRVHRRSKARLTRSRWTAVGSAYQAWRVRDHQAGTSRPVVTVALGPDRRALVRLGGRQQPSASRDVRTRRCTLAPGRSTNATNTLSRRTG